MRHFRGFYAVGCAVFLGTVSSNTMDREVRSWVLRCGVVKRKLAGKEWLTISAGLLQPVVVRDCSGDVEKWELW